MKVSPGRILVSGRDNNGRSEYTFSRSRSRTRHGHLGSGSERKIES